MNKIFSFLTVIVCTLSACSKPQLGGYTKAQVDSAINYKLDSFANAEKRKLDTIIYNQALQEALELKYRNDSIAATQAHRPLPDRNNQAIPDSNANSIPASVLDEQFPPAETPEDD